LDYVHKITLISSKINIDERRSNLQNSGQDYPLKNESFTYVSSSRKYETAMALQHLPTLAVDKLVNGLFDEYWVL